MRDELKTTHVMSDATYHHRYRTTKCPQLPCPAVSRDSRWGFSQVQDVKRIRVEWTSEDNQGCSVFATDELQASEVES